MKTAGRFKEYVNRARRHSAWKKALLAMACVVVFCTTYALILPAITLEGDPVAYCGLEEHTHTAACYTGDPVCGQEASESHTHTLECYQPERRLICDLEETPEPSESAPSADEIGDAAGIAAAAPTEPVLTCALPETQGHTHTQDCYETRSVLVCGQEEAEAHTHDAAACYGEDGSLTCTLPDTQGHTHGEDCYEAQSVLTCGQEEAEAHAHTDSCYAQPEASEPEETQPVRSGHVHTDACYEEVSPLTCGLEEHTHTLSCYANPDADVESAADWEQAFEDLERTGVWADDLLAVAETQLGYAESAHNYLVEEDGATVHGITRYGQWYGQPYAAPWDALFVSFCLHYAGIPEGAVPYAAEASDWVAKLSGQAEGYEDFALYTPVEAGYTPVPGDLVFLDETYQEGEEKTPDHVALVREVTDPLLGQTQLVTVQASQGQVQEVRYDLDDPAITGYVPLPENPEADKTVTQRVEGEDYVVTVSYGPEAALPEDAYLQVSEYDQESSEYQTYYAQAQALYGWGEDAVTGFRLFDIGFYVGQGEETREVEPAAPVQVVITYPGDNGPAGTYDITHFQDTGDPETQQAQSITGQDGRTIEFSLDSFSPVGVSAVVAPIDPVETFAIVDYTLSKAMMPIAVEEYLSASPVEVDFNSDAPVKGNGVAVWQIGDDGKIVATVDAVAKYIAATGDGYGLTLTEDPDQAAVFEIERSARIENTWMLSTTLPLAADQGEAAESQEGDGQAAATATYYVTLDNSGFRLTTAQENASALYLVSSGSVQTLEAGDTVATVSPAGTVINLFDYWVRYGKNDGQHDGQWSGNGWNNNANITADYGINNNHALLFTYNGYGIGHNLANHWTGEDNSVGNALQGLVQDELYDGYPKLSGNTSLFTSDTMGGENRNREESLAYLFDPGFSESNYRSDYLNVGGLLQITSEGYYYYNSEEYYACLDSNNNFQVYEGKMAGFFPFDDYNEARQYAATNIDGYGADYTNPRNDNYNHYFGLTMTTRFVQEYQGYTDSSKSTPTTFEFSGDDDVWIFIDDKLVADLGGIHSRVSVEIDFVEGKVTISNVKNVNDSGQGGSRQAKYFKDIFPEDALDESQTTLKDNTYHTLKFFYLERGGSDSNLMLKYNLKSIPTSSIVKVDQYGESVTNAEFALYTAQKSNDDGTYQYKLDEADEYVSLDDLTYDIDLDSGSTTKGQIRITSGGHSGKTITPIYYGTTDANGNMEFVNEDGMPLALAELRETAGGSEHFILREVVIPEGYRQVSDEIWMYLQNDCLYCDNVYTSGAWSSTIVQVEATQTLYLNDTSINETIVGQYGLKPTGMSEAGYSVDYYNPTDASKTNGTLFAVVLKYSGGPNTVEMNDQANWTPIYGNDLDGYTLKTVDYSDTAKERDAFINAVIDMAQTINGNTSIYGKTVFTQSASGAMELVIENVPGDSKTYFSRLYQTLKDRYPNTSELYQAIAEQVGYTVAYYWTSAEDLGKATAENTFRVYGEAMEGYDGFGRTFGATIEVPNLINRLAVQKYDKDGELVNGATFALYAANAKGEYLTSDGATYVTLTGDYTIDAGGVITVDGSTITPVSTATTASAETNGLYEEGSALLGSTVTDDSGGSAREIVKGLSAGCYYVREISAPAGYAVNDAEIMVYIDENGVYAHAGTAGDGVSVARGPGYLASTMHQFASKDNIDSTLTWIYEMMRVSSTDGSGEDFKTMIRGADGPAWGYLTQNGNAENLTNESIDAWKVYLEYDPDSQNSLFDYQLTVGRNPVSTDRRLETDRGWSYYEIYQDSEWAEKQLATGVKYTNLEGQEIANLFSRSTYIRVTDQRVSNLEISKTVKADAGAIALDDTFSFTVSLYSKEPTDQQDPPWLTGTYPYTVYSGSGETATGEITYTQGTGCTGTISLQDGQRVVIEGLPEDAYYTVTETISGSNIYTTTVQVEDTTLVTGATVSGRMAEWRQDDYTTTLAYTNTYVPAVTLTLEKVAAGTDTKLPGAQFVLYKTADGVPQYYVNNGTDGVAWESAAEQKSETDFALTTTGPNGTYASIQFQGLTAGEYTLKEVDAPDGYNRLADTVTITVQPNGAISASKNWMSGSTTSGYILTVPNTAGERLPDTGGTGTTPLTLLGLTLMAVAALPLVRRKRRSHS